MFGAKWGQAAAEIIAAKGATNWAIGLSTARILDAILRDENAVLTVTRLMEDYHGISDVCLSALHRKSRRGGRVLAVPMDEEELAALRASAEVVKATCVKVGLNRGVTVP